ncbi:MAG: DinB family protein [Pseudomonadota bacterium]
MMVQLFNHQTHHRSQVTSALHSMGIEFGTTDIPWRPGAGYLAG